MIPIATVPWGQLLDQAGSQSFEALPPNKYNVEVAKAEAAQASTGKLMFKVAYKVLDGPHANRQVFTNFVVTPDSSGAMRYFFKHMAAMGLSEDFFRQQPTPDTVANSLVGKRCTVDVGQKEYQGEIRNEVKSVLRPTGDTSAPPPPAPPAPPAPPTPTPTPAAEASTESSAPTPPAVPF